MWKNIWNGLLPFCFAVERYSISTWLRIEKIQRIFTYGNFTVRILYVFQYQELNMYNTYCHTMMPALLTQRAWNETRSDFSYSCYGAIIKELLHTADKDNTWMEEENPTNSYLLWQWNLHMLTQLPHLLWRRSRQCFLS